MIELFRPAGSTTAAEIETTLKTLVVSHRVITVESSSTPASLPPGTPLPALRENGQIITGAAIPAYLKELAKFVADWRKFQSDSCYIDEEGTIC